MKTFSAPEILVLTTDIATVASTSNFRNDEFEFFSVGEDLMSIAEIG